MKDKSLPREIPATEKTFQVDVIGKVTNKRFVGDFTCRIPRIKEQCLIEKHQAFLNGEMVQFLPPGVIKMHKMISYLRYTLSGDLPKFWKETDLGYELQDLNVVEKIYDEVLDFEEEWLKQIWGDPKETKEDEQAGTEEQAKTP